VQDLLERAAAPDPPRLTDDEYAMLRAHYRTHFRYVSIRELKGVGLTEQERQAKARREAIRCTLEFNRKIRETPSATGTEPPKQPPESAAPAQSEGGEPGSHEPPSKSPRRKKPGRPSDTDPKADERIFDAWKTGQYPSREELARAFGMSLTHAIQALDRHRHRIGKIGRSKSSQEH
jgi:hypothetical protein